MQCGIWIKYIFWFESPAFNRVYWIHRVSMRKILLRNFFLFHSIPEVAYNVLVARITNTLCGLVGGARWKVKTLWKKFLMARCRFHIFIVYNNSLRLVERRSCVWVCSVLCAMCSRNICAVCTRVLDTIFYKCTLYNCRYIVKEKLF